jgi:hypothetical protein
VRFVGRNEASVQRGRHIYLASLDLEGV